MIIDGSNTVNKPGLYNIKLTVNDSKGASASVTKIITVLPLGIQGYVRHTDAWEANRLHYNNKHPDSPRSANWFWAGEAFVLEAAVTDTGTSSTKPVSVSAAATPELRKNLIAVSPSFLFWKELLQGKDTGKPFELLPQGPYVFVFTVTYSNGVTKTSNVTIQLVDTIDQYVNVHRIQ
jgi:PKD repeat protein